MRDSEIRVKGIRVNQGVGVFMRPFSLYATLYQLTRPFLQHGLPLYKFILWEIIKCQKGLR